MFSEEFKKALHFAKDFTTTSLNEYCCSNITKKFKSVEDYWANKSISCTCVCGGCIYHVRNKSLSSEIIYLKNLISLVLTNDDFHNFYIKKEILENMNKFPRILNTINPDYIIKAEDEAAFNNLFLGNITENVINAIIELYNCIKD